MAQVCTGSSLFYLLWLDATCASAPHEVSTSGCNPAGKRAPSERTSSLARARALVECVTLSILEMSWKRFAGKACANLHDHG